MSLKITTLIENSQGEHKGLHIEHGLSFMIEKENHSILFDTGSSSGFIENAGKLSLDLTKVQHVILSHGHYDHTGGFRFFTEIRPDSQYTLWTGPDFFMAKYGRYGPSLQYLGNDFDLNFLEEKAVVYKTVSAGKTEILPGVWIVNGFSKTHIEEKINPRFVIRDESSGNEHPDDFHDEVLIAVKCRQGLVVLVGCSHPGILNMLGTVKALFTEPIYILLGGTHLIEADEQRINHVADIFIRENISLIGISHCTGENAVSVLQNKSRNFFRNCTGTTLFIE